MRQLELEYYRRGDRVWIVVIGPLNREQAQELVERVGVLAADPGVRRVSVDATCARCVDGDAGALLERLRTCRSAWLDVTTAGIVNRLEALRAAA
jgi:hypothetical protein